MTITNSTTIRTDVRNVFASRLGLLDALVAVVCVLTYVLRLSLITYVMNPSVADAFFIAASAALILAILCVLLSGIERLDIFGSLIILATAASLITCERLDYSLPRWAGWMVICYAFGPVCITRKAVVFRRFMLSTAQYVFTAAILLSAVWWMLGLPHLGRGDFSGVMWHSMTLGAMSAFVGVMAIARAQVSNSLLWYALFALSSILTLLAASRAALAGLALGTLIVLVLRIKRNIFLSWFAVLIGLCIAVVPDASVEYMLKVVPESFVSGLLRKSFEHTREAHWEARWEEFNSSPWTGVGLGSAWIDSVGYDPETGAVETGSSYLAIMSMTGILGISAFILLVLSRANMVHRKWNALSVGSRLEICGISGFWFVHLGAEGYIYAVGSPMALLFWLWLGCLSDELRQSGPRLHHQAANNRKVRPKLQTGGSSLQPYLPNAGGFRS